MEIKYKLYCLNCHNTRYSNGNDISDLTEVPISKIFGSISILDKNNKIVKSDPIDRPKKIKCPKCGHIFKIIKIQKEEKDEQANSFDGS
jgi:hypothetical protein